MDDSTTQGGQDDSSGDDSAPQDLEKQIADLQQQNAKLTELAARAQADLQNAKMRLGKDADDLRKFAAESVIRRLLPVIDNFQRAFQHLPAELKNNEWVKGVMAIEQDLMRQMTEMGLKKMNVMGEMADSAIHEILNVGPGKEGIVTEVHEEGYELNGKVLRPAKVKVGDGSKA